MGSGSLPGQAAGVGADGMRLGCSGRTAFPSKNNGRLRLLGHGLKSPRVVIPRRRQGHRTAGRAGGLEATRPTGYTFP